MDGGRESEKLEVHKEIDWWKDFFTGLTLDLWRAVIRQEQTHAEADFLQTNLRLPPLANVLDVPCGNGRLSLELAARGFQLTGVDISEGFLEEARSAAAKLQLKITFEHREMRDLPWQGGFDGVFCFGNSFGFLDDDGNADFLKAIYHVLKPGRRFVLDAASVAENILPKFQERSETQIGDIIFKEENRYDHILSRLDTEYTFIRNGKVEQRFGSHRIYTYRELCRLLETVGFVVTETYGSLSQEPFKFGSQQLFVVATKKTN